MRKNKKGSGHIPLAAWLGYLLAVTFLVTGVTFSSYITTTSGGDSARVARWSFAQDGLNEALVVSLVPGQTVSHTLKAQHGSEVAVDYTVSVYNTTDNLPLTYSLKLGEHEYPLTEKGAGVFACTYPLDPVSSATDYAFQLLITWPKVSEVSDLAKTGMVDLLSIQVQAAQKD